MNLPRKFCNLSLVLLCGSIATCSLYADDLSSLSLSQSALDSLVAHYDGRKGVGTNGNVVESWTPVDANGNAIDSMIINSTQRGAGAADLITYDGNSTLSFDDTSVGADGRYLNGTLTNSQTTEMTVFWLGHYEAGAPFDTSGTYAYNIGLSDISHQRDDGGGGFNVEIYNGTTYAGDDITAYDGIGTVWSTVVTSNSHTAYANGVDLNVAGSPTYNIGENAEIVVGAFSGGGFDLVGDISQLIIFESALSDSDRLVVESYLTSIPEPASGICIVCVFTVLSAQRRRKVL